MLISFTYHYLIAQVLAVISLISLSLFLATDNENAFSQNMLLSTSGEISIDNVKYQGSYQLLAKSRVSFIGCWLFLVPKETKFSQQQKLCHPHAKELFLFRDSISDQDYSRLVRVIQQLDKSR